MKTKQTTKIPLGTYQHSKSGKMYMVMAVAKHSETLEDLVVYEALYDNPESRFWVRPLQNFLEEVEINGEKVPRFKFQEAVGEQSYPVFQASKKIEQSYKKAMKQIDSARVVTDVQATLDSL